MIIRNNNSSGEIRGSKGGRARGAWVLVIVTLVTAVVVAGCFGEKTLDIKEKTNEMYKTTDYFQGNFSIYGVPSLNQSVNLIFSVDSIEDMPNSKIKLFLPEEISIVNGSDQWNGDLKKGEKIQLNTTIIVNTSGEWELRAYVESVLSSGYKEYRSYYFDFSIMENSSAISSTPAKTNTEQTPKKET